MDLEFVAQSKSLLPEKLYRLKLEKQEQTGENENASILSSSLMDEDTTATLILAEQFKS